MAAQTGKRYVIIGNGIAGTTCAQTLRQNDLSCEIWLITNEPYPLYNRVSLKRLLDGVLPEQQVMMRDLAWHDQQRITLLRETYVTHVDALARMVYLNHGGPLSYDALLIASGGWPNHLDAPGADQAPHLYTFMTLDDTKQIIARVLESKTAITTGGSYMAYDLTEGLSKRGIHVTWLMRGPFWLRRTLDAEGGKLVDDIVARHDIEVVHGEEIREVTMRDGALRGVIGVTGREYTGDLIGLGVGLTLNHAFLQDTPVVRRKGIVTDEYLKTTTPDVFAAGDVAEFYDPILGAHRTLGTWDNALSQGRVVARNMAGAHEAYLDVPTRSSPLFDTNIVAMGLFEVTDPAVETLQRALPTERGGADYRRFFFRENKLVGAVFLGSPKGRKKVVELIRAGATYRTGSEREALFEVR
ncbi:MAG TPA: FAD-dependent oxidoreductase [Ktedonobacterales bacterium]|nr:FAD-dependent oxidoreductase [Ktedonobacterales bacterium]